MNRGPVRIPAQSPLIKLVEPRASRDLADSAYPVRLRQGRRRAGYRVLLSVRSDGWGRVSAGMRGGHSCAARAEGGQEFG